MNFTSLKGLHMAIIFMYSFGKHSIMYSELRKEHDKGNKKLALNSMGLYYYQTDERGLRMIYLPLLSSPIL